MASRALTTAELLTVRSALRDSTDSNSSQESDRLLSTVARKVIVKDPETAFDKVRATRSYSISTVHYGVILPLKEKTIGLTKDQATNLDLYRKHTALCSGIDKVQKAYRQYTAAQEAAKGVTDDAKVAAAQFEEHKQAGILSTSYNELLELATTQARDLGVSEAVVKADVHKALSQKEKGLIVSTINMVREKFAIDNSDPEVEFQDKYVELVSGLVGHVRQAMKNSGTYDRAAIGTITQAMIEGLASISDFEEDDLQIIECHAQLVRLQKGELPEKRTEMEQRLVSYFTQQLKDLINAKAPITRARLEVTRARLEEIQYNGISLLSVIKLSDKEINVLNELRKLKSESRQINERVATIGTAIAQQDAFLTQVHACPVSQVTAFLTAVDTEGKFERTNKNKFADAPADSIFTTGAGFKSYRETLVQLAEVEKQITALDASASPARAALTTEIAELDAEKMRLTGVIEGLEETVEGLNEEIADSEKLLREYDAEFKKDKARTLGDEKKLTEGAKRFRAKKLEGILEKCQAEELALQNQIATARGQLSTAQERLGGNQRALQNTEARLTELRARGATAEAQYQADLGVLVTKRAALNNQTVDLTGDDLRQLANYMGIVRAVQPGFDVPGDNLLYGNYETARGAHQRGVEFRHVELGWRALADEKAGVMAAQIAQLAGTPVALNFDPVTQSFGVKVKQSEEVRGNLATEIDANLEIAQEMTLRVAQAIVDKDKAKNETAAQEVKLASTRKALRRESALSQAVSELRDPEQELEVMIASRIGIKLVDPIAEEMEAGFVPLPSSRTARVLPIASRSSEFDEAPLSDEALAAAAAVSDDELPDDASSAASGTGSAASSDSASPVEADRRVTFAPETADAQSAQKAKPLARLTVDEI